MRDVHYFQRYHTKENMHTANAMLLLSRLYYYSPNKFYDFLQYLFGEEDVDFKVQIKTQLKAGKKETVPDAGISQDSFKIVVETKLYNNFGIDQLKGHIDSFRDENHKLLLTLDCEELIDQEKAIIKDICKDKKVQHVHLTFASLIEYISEYIDDRDIEFQDILDDYGEYCDECGLLPRNKFKVVMRLARTTFDKNIELNLYYDGKDKGYSTCGYLGLYKNKSMRAIGKIVKRCVISVKNSDLNDLNDLDVVEEIGSISEEDKKKIKEAIIDAQNYDYDLITRPHRFFLVDKFYETDFQKESKGAPLGKRIFDICNVLGIKDNHLPPVSEIAELLKGKTWK